MLGIFAKFQIIFFSIYMLLYILRKMFRCFQKMFHSSTSSWLYAYSNSIPMNNEMPKFSAVLFLLFVLSLSFFMTDLLLVLFLSGIIFSEHSQSIKFYFTCLCKPVMNNSSSIFKSFFKYTACFSYIWLAETKLNPTTLFCWYIFVTTEKLSLLFQAPKMNVGFTIIFCFCIFQH